MTGSPDRKQGSFTGLTLTGLTLACFTLASLTLMALPGPASAQVQLFPQPTAPADTAPQTAPSGPSAPEGISVESLGSVDDEAVGALTSADDALPAELWTGLSRASIVALIDALPSGGDFPALRDLSRRLLLTAASLPPPQQDPPISVLRARVEALARLGFAQEAAMLAQIGQSALTDPDGRIAVAKAQLAAYDLAAACGTAVQAAAGSADFFWAKLIALCQAVAGQRDQASLAAQTLLDMGDDDPLYFSLMDSIALGLAPEVTGMTASGPMHYAMLRFAEAPVPADAQDPGVALLAARSQTDLAAVEMAAQRGILPPAELAERYLGERFKDSALDKPFEVLDRVSPAAARALLYQVVQRWQIPALKAEALSVAMMRARRDNMDIAAAGVFAAPALTIPPTADLLWFAEDAARLLYWTGHLDRARAWHALLRNAAGTDSAAAAGDARLWHLAMLSGETGGALGRSRQNWEQAVIAGAQDPEAGRQHLDLLQALVGAATGADALSSEADIRARAMRAPALEGASAGPLTLDLMARAAQAGRIGEAASLSLAALSAAPARRINGGTLVASVRALAEVGLLKDARRLALEASILLAPDPVEVER